MGAAATLIIKLIVISETVFILKKERNKKEEYSPRATLVTKNQLNEQIYPRSPRSDEPDILKSPPSAIEARFPNPDIEKVLTLESLALRYVRGNELGGGSSIVSVFWCPSFDFCTRRIAYIRNPRQTATQPSNFVAWACRWRQLVAGGRRGIDH